MSDAEHPDGDSEPPEKERTKRVVRRVGRTVFIGAGFAMFVLMMVGVVQGIRQERAWNPYTGHPHREGECRERARELMLDAGEMERLTPRWIGRYREWVSRCEGSHQELHELLRETHSELQRLPDEE